jgi:hypothetical protein
MSKVIDFSDIRTPLLVAEDELEDNHIEYLGVFMKTKDGNTIVTESGLENLTLSDICVFEHQFTKLRQQLLEEMEEEAERF